MKQGDRSRSAAFGPRSRVAWQLTLAGGAAVDVRAALRTAAPPARRATTRPRRREDDRVSRRDDPALAREMAAAKAAMIYASTGACKHYHSDLMHRSFALLMALTGNQGKPGGGLRVGAWWGVSGFDDLGLGEMPALAESC